MSTISNRFFVSAIDDGATLHGNLACDKTLSQGWDAASQTCSPNWATDTSSRPTIYLTLLNGNAYVQPTSASVEWYYGTKKLTFDANGYSTNTDITGIAVGTFYSTTVTVNSISMPALTIVKNIASSATVDVQTITLKASYNSGGTAIGFSASIQVRITALTSGGYLGVVQFINGVSNFTEKNQTITMVGRLYGGDTGSEITTGFETVYIIDGVSHSPNTITSIGAGYELNEADVTDNTIVQVTFRKPQTYEVFCSTFVSIDDLTDPEFMYIQFNSQNGQSATLRKDEDVKFDIWVGSMTDTTVDTDYAYFYIKLLNAQGDVVTTSLSTYNIAEADANGWRQLAKDNTTQKAYITINYTMTSSSTFNNNLTGIVMATTQSLTT